MNCSRFIASVGVIEGGGRNRIAAPTDGHEWRLC